MARSFKLEVITPSKMFYSGEVEQIIIKTPEGYEGFMADHSWACKLLDAGEFRIKESGTSGNDWKVASAAGGFIDVKDSVVVYTDAIEWSKGREKRRSRTIEK